MKTALIQRKAIFGNPDRIDVKLSPDGSQLGWLAPRNGVLNVWIAPGDDPKTARPVTDDTGRGIRFYFWGYTNRHILYIQDINGDENWRLYSVDLDTEEVKDLTPFENVQAQVNQVSPEYPDEALISLNNRDVQYHDLYRLNIHTGEMSLICQNDQFLGFITDHHFKLRGALRMTSDGSTEIMVPAGEDWRVRDQIPAEDNLTTWVIGFDKSGKKMYLKDSRGRNTTGLFVENFETGESTLLAEDLQADAEDFVIHPTEKNIQAVSFIYARKRWKYIDPSIEPDIYYLHTVTHGDVEIVSRTLDDRYWIVVYVLDDHPTSYYLYNRDAKSAKFLFTSRPGLEEQPLVKMLSTIVKSRDGLDLVVYYSLPIDGTSNGGDKPDGIAIPRKPLPMVLFPHGGPWGRDYWGYNPYHQWLANRGYATLSVNFRSSTGFGKAFTNAGDNEWGGKIMEDQVDAVLWAIDQGIADPNKIAVMGGSFGGYSTLAGLAFYPELYTCGVDLVGPSNLITLLESIPPYWTPMVELFTTRVGDFRTEEGRNLLTAHSPLTHVDNICSPLLIGQGANDPRVKQAESDQIVKAMQEKNIPVTYLLYPDEGHGFARPENNLSFFAIAETFLAEHLGGRCEPFGDDFDNSSVQVLAGVDGIPGLAKALENIGKE